MHVATSITIRRSIRNVTFLTGIYCLFLILNKPHKSLIHEITDFVSLNPYPTRFVCILTFILSIYSIFIGIKFILKTCQVGVLCTVAAAVGGDEPSCGEDQSLFEGLCYWSDPTLGPYQWREAKDECKRRGLQLACIHSEQEQEFVYGE